MNTSTQADEGSLTFQFTELGERQMMVVNDSVMGGVSRSTLNSAQDHVHFTGTVSLENNGGFASARMIWPFSSESMTEQSQTLRLKIKGDGKSYQFRLRTNRGFDGAAYSHQFQTLAGQEQVLYIPVDQFVPTFRGRVLSNMPDLRLQDVQQMGVLIADYQTGEFAIDLISLEVI